MVTVFEVIFVVVGALLFLFAPRIADQRASAHFSAVELEATDEHTRRRVKRFKIAAVVANMAVGAAMSVLTAIALLR